MTDSITHSLTRTQMQRARVSRGLAPRPHLLERLDTSHSLEFVLAPAGYGKTTLSSMWLETCDISKAWLSLDGSSITAKLLTCGLEPCESCQIDSAMVPDVVGIVAVHDASGNASSWILWQKSRRAGQTCQH